MRVLDMTYIPVFQLWIGLTRVKTKILNLPFYHNLATNPASKASTIYTSKYFVETTNSA